MLGYECTCKAYSTLVQVLITPVQPDSFFPQLLFTLRLRLIYRYPKKYRYIKLSTSFVKSNVNDQVIMGKGKIYISSFVGQNLFPKVYAS